MTRHILTRDGVVVYDFTDGAAPEPPKPTTPPVEPTPPGSKEVPLDKQNWLDDAQPEIVYYYKLPFPFSTNMSVQIGQGRTGATPTHGIMGVSDKPGVAQTDSLTADGDPNGGFSLTMSLNPSVDRGGKPQQAKVTNDRQWYGWFVLSGVVPNKSNGIVYYPY